jgi:rhodanese-related sulfurtransferase
VRAQLPAETQTTLGLYVTARDAYEKWKAAPEKVTILDVRTAEEFIFVGYAEMAWNIPVVAQSYQRDINKKQFPSQPLSDFVPRVQEVAKPNETLLVMCRSGAHSALAVNAHVRAGFKNVYNITDGMEGDVVQDSDSVFRGQRLLNGLKSSGLPWTYHIDPARMVLPPRALAASEGGQTAKHHLPAVPVCRKLAETRGLASYGTGVPEMFQWVADLVGRILMGAMPAGMQQAAQNRKLAPSAKPPKLRLSISLSPLWL